MRVSHSAFKTVPSLLLSLVTAIPLLAQSPPAGEKSKSAHDDWNAPTQAAPHPQGQKAGKADKNMSDGAAKGQASELRATNPNRGAGSGKNGDERMKSKSAADNWSTQKQAPKQATWTEGGKTMRGDWNAPASISPKPKSGGKPATDDWQAPASAAPQPATGTPKGKSATDDWQSSK